MFNDLNNPTNQEHPAVDDIFAETEKAQEANVGNNASMPSGEIEAQKIGLAAGAELSETPTDKSGGKWFKIIIIVIIAAILILSAYLVYSKFFQNTSNLNVNATAVNTGTAVTPTVEVKTESPVATTSEENTASSTGSEGTVVVPSISEVAPTSSLATTAMETEPVSNTLLDSDNDGLTDLEEKSYGTNINVVDTDNDGLSDYEEVKIYHTNPLKPDTDGDGYADGAEVKSGYNPNGAGKLSTTTPATTVK